MAGPGHKTPEAAGEIIDLDDYDFDTDSDFSAKKTPTKKSPYFTQPTQIIPRSSPFAHETQATQIAPRTTLGKKPTLQDLIASSPRSVVEVPVSPNVRVPLKGKLAQSMAPAGTSFRPPARAAPLAQAKKRSYVNISDDDLAKPIFDDDSSDDDTPMRGDIKPSTFVPKKPAVLEPPLKKQATGQPKSISADSKQRDARLVQLTSKLFREARLKSDVRIKLEDCKKALLRHDLVYGDALKDLLYGPVQIESSPEPEPKRDSDFEDEPNPVRRGRLVQGRRNRSPVAAPAPSRSATSARNSPKSRPAPTTKVVDLINSDKSSAEESEAEYTEAESGDDRDARNREAEELKQALAESAVEAREKRVLEYLNTCSKSDLMSIAKITETKATAMLKHKPFATVDEAMAVRTLTKSKTAKKKKDDLGWDVYNAVDDFVRYLDSIDKIVGLCERRTKDIRAATSKWNLDIYGKPRSGETPPPGESACLTPSSTGSNEEKLVPLPITREPSLMEGHCTLKSYQLYGLNWLYTMFNKRIGGILADDMGLGKTCQVISVLCQMIDGYNNTPKRENIKRPWPNLVIVPPSTLGNWEAEFEKFAPDLKVTVYKGAQDERDELFREMKRNPEEHEVILTSYSQIGRDDDATNLHRLRPTAIVFDEGHALKNPITNVYKRLFRIEADWKLMLTGTPIQNNLMELMALLQMLEPRTFQDHMGDLQALFEQKVSLKAVSDGALLVSDRVNRASSILNPFILQRKKEQVLELPPKKHSTIYCDLHALQKPIYREFESKFATTKALAKDKTASGENNPWIQTKKASLHPYLFRRFFTDDKVDKMAKVLWKNWPSGEVRPDTQERLAQELKQYSDFELHLWCRDVPALKRLDFPDDSLLSSGKVQKVVDLVREYKSNGDRVLIFTTFQMMVPILQEVFDHEGISNRQFEGATDVSVRQDLIDEFNHDESITAFIITTGSGATGINLTSANKVIIFDPSDNPQRDIQAENRAHRIGQTRPVEVIRLVTKGTIEELILAAGERKIELARKVTGQDGAEQVEMTELEMKKTVRQGLLERGGGIATPKSEQ